MSLREIGMNKRHLQKIILFFALLVLAVAGCSDNWKKPKVVINEICSCNFSAGRDENGRYSDCVELYNPGKADISLNGCFLTDDEKDPQKYSLEGLMVPAGGFILVWLDQNAGLRISREGDKLFLADAVEGTFLDQVIVPRLNHDTSYGRVQDGGSRWAVMTTTLGSTNQDAELLPAVSLDSPIFEIGSGFYKEAFDLHLYSPTGEKIYYTLDGSEPDASSPVYREPIRITDRTAEENRYINRDDLAPNQDYEPAFPVDKAVVVRAACYNPVTSQISETVTQTYFVGYDAKPEYDDLAILSLSVDPEALFDAHTGIYGNGAAFEAYLSQGGMQNGQILDSYTDAGGEIHYRYMASNAFYKGKEWEREASLSYFDESHTLLFTQNAGVRISGNSTRSARQKSFHLFARDIYDESEILPAAFFDNDILYASVKLRNGGGNMDGVKFLDAFLQEAARGRSVTTQAHRPCALFLNGEYWGLYNLRERYNAEYLSAHYGLQADDIMLIKAGNAVTSPEETFTAWQYMLDVVTQCDLVYDDTYALADELVDIQSLIDYCCINLYLDNRDVAFGYNTAAWRTTQEGTPYSDGKWRFMLYDLDECTHADSNIWENREDWMAQHPLLNEPAVKSLLDNEGFRRRFCLSFMDIANTVFSYEKMHDMLAQWSSRCEAQIIKDHRCFYDADYTAADYQADVEQVDAFFEERLPFAMESLAKTFGLTGALHKIRIVTDTPEGGTITVNTAVLEDCGTWEGYYYSDFPLSVTAHAREGYYFAGWQGDVPEGGKESLSVSLADGDVTLRAVFEKND